MTRISESEAARYLQGLLDQIARNGQVKRVETCLACEPGVCARTSIFLSLESSREWCAHWLLMASRCYRIRRSVLPMSA